LSRDGVDKQLAVLTAKTLQASLCALRVGKLDPPLDLVNRKRGEAFAKLIDSFPKVETVDNGVWQDARTAHDGRPDSLPGTVQ
jgi:hypothetical protein